MLPVTPGFWCLLFCLFDYSGMLSIYKSFQIKHRAGNSCLYEKRQKFRKKPPYPEVKPRIPKLAL